jgi:hypothetical protein
MLIYGSEAWTVCKRDESRIRAAEMKFMRTAGYIRLDYEKALDQMKESNTRPITGFIKRYKCEWKNCFLVGFAQESHSKVSVANNKDKALWGDHSNPGTRP